MANKKTNENGKIREKSNLVVNNFGDTVIIKNRSTVASGILGAVLMALLIWVMVMLKGAWSSLIFWVVFAFLFLSSAHWLLNAMLGKIVLDSPKMLMTVYSPFKKEYKFSDINYVDIKSAKPKDGRVVHSVRAYIGKGKRSVKIDTTSKKQADEIHALLAGMLDVAAMEYPEGVYTTYTEQED